MTLNRKKVLLWGMVAAAVLFALFGGQYTTLDLLSQRAVIAARKQTIDSLKHEIDSLTGYRKALATDPRLQERIARERWFMSREGEIVYKFMDEK
jgi:cell division protein FtsB